MPTSPENVAQLYGSIAEYEETRLATHPMEREITLRTIRHWLDAMSSTAGDSARHRRILDVGGGPGKLAFILADQGHHVDLLDLSPDLVQLARNEQSRLVLEGSKSLASIAVGNALDLSSMSLHEASYDAVLLLGPLYHLLDETERKQAVENALHLAKPATGLVFCAFVSIEAHLRDLAMREPARVVQQKGFYDRYVGDRLLYLGSEVHLASRKR